MFKLDNFDAEAARLKAVFASEKFGRQLERLAARLEPADLDAMRASGAAMTRPLADIYYRLFNTWPVSQGDRHVDTFVALIAHVKRRRAAK